MDFERTADSYRRHRQTSFRPATRRRYRRRRSADRPHSYRSRFTLLSRGEAAFFAPLQAAVGATYLVMCKVRLADVVTCPVRRDRRGPFAAISQKHLDFVLCHPISTRIILAIELDDRSHETPRRKKRDTLVNEALFAAGVPLLRVKAQASYSEVTLRESVQFAIAGNETAYTATPNPR